MIERLDFIGSCRNAGCRRRVMSGKVNAWAILPARKEKAPTAETADALEAWNKHRYVYSTDQRRTQVLCAGKRVTAFGIAAD